MIGQTISHYKILEKLGEGGMGVVYKAHDTKLNREVAIKFLPAHISKAGIERERFLHEAQAVAALNHPNICVIHEINDDAEQPFIVMEYVDGSTIRTKLENGPFKTDDAVKYGIQIGEALQEAHSKGIVHRDIKADNIIINSKGQAKVMDFGLAKLKGSLKLTKTSSTVGTLGYMAPEQIQGGEVDARSDIFAFAVLFFEMLTGRLPFRGEHEAAMVYSIVNEEPEPIQNILPEISGEIVHILGKALEKDPEDRFQTIQDLVVDLRRSKKDTSRVGRLSGVSKKVSQPEIAVGEPDAHSSKTKLWIGVGALAVVLVAGALYYFTVGINSSPSLPPMKTINFTSYAGGSGFPAFSPDGNSIAFVWNGEHQDNFDIYVKLIDAGSPLRLTHDPAPDLYPAWSPDGRYVSFLRSQGNGGSYYIIPSLGGDERKIADVKLAGAGIDWSTDGKSLIVSASDSGNNPRLLRVSVESGIKQVFTSMDVNGSGGVNGDNYPKISPDGKTVAFIKILSYSISEIYTVPFVGGEEKRLTFDSLLVGGIAWTANGEEIVFSSNRGGNTTLWRIPKNGGTPTAVSGSGDNVGSVTIAAKGYYLAYDRSEQSANIWRFDLGKAASSKQAPTEFISSSGLQRESEFSHDGKHLVFTSNQSGNGMGGNEIWRCNADGTNQIELTFFRGPSAGSPQWSPDDRFITFDSREKGNGNIYIISSSGGTPRQLTTNSAEDNIPRWSNDGRWIYFSSNRTGEYQIWKVSVDGGKEIQVTKKGGYASFESVDGKSLYFVKSGPQSTIMKLSLTGGDEEPVDKRLNGIHWGAWIITGKGIYFAKNDSIGQSKIYFYNFTNREIKQILETPKTIYISSGTLAISPDGHYLLFTQFDRVTSDIMLIQNFQ